ncbi:methylmalonyl Co-A mutase-associated GTPase MeaB [Acuticoccus sediminis]|uniref:Methylmalonyl Co-A mutase-associated GTPase MeaB n=1 Tax=Acuticoccus sediminis TaxID=2184697 RepID=A0A8B2NJ12_9HYPH|nr:methylmalonyl Co-A mutase-associated GTPase MeaB [Acuticoccus sediminis]RAH99375.1 methylmalonyl Co-A mutase-associated GTPase MeaB [Acuticoccus sediminis]
MARQELTDLAVRVRAGERAALARAITLVESRRAEHRADAAALIQEVLPATGKALRVGITGVPGVGKSTLIDALGTMLIEQGERVAVLAIDPSSTRTGGAILGDKTRMANLSARREAFIRPSPSAGSLGGVAARTREAMLLAEAAGFTVIIVETVGVGQSELAVADMVDTYLALMLPGAGDELQGIKKGLLERADIIAVNKADGDAVSAARIAAAELISAVKILATDAPPEVLTVSARTGEKLAALWASIVGHRDRLASSGALDVRRREQNVVWMRDMIADGLQAYLAQYAGDALAATTDAVRSGNLAPSVGAQEILARLPR